ncbi:Flavin-dependent oxidoreductase, F420-dependent methylene-tetrahydromethanopterin reductase [Frankia canadensis]|uniref:Flavin-dependent oxidoreductase, F420-dependent methylene-tetrahydromethanopterin reductase n=1 Tax=Frankia canadensis TaxID=1836972 RepID=A0A2I2KQR9_9ACTN|nr:LLM class flavin-dependent oxidoreductase [Frankia canadensis]SNQ47999.1 Flavin-dependent oxidoreductase, F420-dependent methylene-tetrahydromethanopterin reductase [Frankia canadensis]SOU55289.1 Flavin-dependent oxidoreductase, F420-dependent methylene-tetrahydromethanopterin reductase [Frankia canadensis]
MDLGLISFGSLLPDPRTGVALSQRQRLRDVVRAAADAEEFGYAWYAVGEHHFGERDVIPSPAVVLAAIAEHTSTIRLATGTTLVANRDPVLVAEDYALVDLLSDGRLELVAGASFFPDPWTVFGHDPQVKAARKREAVELLLRLWTEDRVTWQGRFRPPLDDVRVQPRPAQAAPPLWISAGVGSGSVRLAVDHGLPLIAGTTARPPVDFVDVFDAYRREWSLAGRPGPSGRLGAASHVFVAPTSQAARATWSQYITSYLSARLPSHGGSPRPFDFDEYIGPDGPAICGSPAEVVDRLGALHGLWGHDLHLLAIDIGGIPADEVRAATELLASDVLPQVASLGATAARPPADPVASRA